MPVSIPLPLLPIDPVPHIRRQQTASRHAIGTQRSQRLRNLRRITQSTYHGVNAARMYRGKEIRQIEANHNRFTRMWRRERNRIPPTSKTMHRIMSRNSIE